MRYLFKCLNYQIFGSSKSPPNLFQISISVIFLFKSEKKVVMSGQAVFCPNLFSTPISAKLSIFQIYVIHFHALHNLSPQIIVDDLIIFLAPSIMADDEAAPPQRNHRGGRVLGFLVVQTTRTTSSFPSLRGFSQMVQKHGVWLPLLTRQSRANTNFARRKIFVLTG